MNKTQLFLEQYKQLLENKKYYTEPNSTFTHNKNKYYVNDLLELSRKYQVKDYKVDDLKWIFKYAEIETDRPNKPDLKYPIILTDYGRRLVVIDGLHRLSKAIKDNIETIKGIYIPNSQIEKLTKVPISLSIHEFKIYHYFWHNPNVKSILKHGLLSIDELHKMNMYPQAEWDKYIGRDGIQDPNEYFKKVYDDTVRDIIGKEYSTNGLFFTTVDLFSFPNKAIARVEIKLKDLIKKHDIIYEDNISGRFKVSNIKDLEKVILATEEYEDPYKVQKLYFTKNKRYMFENLPQVWVVSKKLKIKKNMIRFR